MVKYGFLHCHTQNSVKDSVMTVKRLCQRAKEMEAPAVAIADHGVLTGIPSFLKAATEFGIKPIVGCEYYVKEFSYDKRLHLIVYAKDLIGYQAMMKAVKLSNKRIEKVRTMLFPALNEEIIKTCFGPGSKGYGHVIATSACVNGVLAGLILQNEAYKKEAEKLAEQLSEFERNKDLLESHEAKKEAIEKRIDEIQHLTLLKFGKEKRAAEKLSEDEKVKALAEIAEKEVAVERAKAEVAQLKTTKNTICKQITLCKNKFSGKGGALIEKYAVLKELREKICDRPALAAKMRSETLRYQQIFGKENFYIELQFHGMFEEKEAMMELDRIAQELNIPVVAANDAHMATNSEEDLMGRETVRSLRFMKMEPLEDSDKELYLKDDEELYKAIRQVVTPERAKIAMENVGKIVEQCNYEPSKEKHYPVFDKSVDSFELLKKMTYEGVQKRFPGGFPSKEYDERLEYELAVIKKMGVSDYHLIVQDLVNFTKKLGKMPEDRYNYLKENIWNMTFEQIIEYVEADQTYVGMTVGPGRGSSAGSLVCYCIGITDLDPIEHGLLFERYLNPERVTMPDIDTDYANGYRDVAVVYTYKKYGEDAVCRIITYAKSAPKSAIKDVAKAIGISKGQEDEYVALGDALADVIPQKPKEHIATYLPIFEEMNQKNPKVDEIIKRAMSIEGAYNHYGMHAAGVIISDNDDVNEYVPLSWDDVNKQWKCQMDMVEAEEAGLLKMDYLGLKNLNIITEMLRLIYKRTGRKIDPQTDIKEETEVIKAICASGKTNAIFQLESAGMKDVEKKLGTDKFADLVLLLAAYRPGPMDSISSMIAVKHGKAPEYRHPMLEHILKDTYGSLIYQEQVQQIFRDLAGYSFGRADLVRRAMSKKKEAVFLAEKPIFVNGDPESGIKGCVANGIPAEVAEQIFDDMVDFAKYAFNKSHAAAYARVTYILCWLKYYYPIEFMTVALSWASEKQLVALIAECKSMGIEVKPVDINRSGAKFSIVDEKIYFGMTSIKGIGAVEPIMAARKKAAFSSFHDYYRRGHFKKNVTEGLINAGAFDYFCKNRKALMMAFEEMEECAGGKSKNNSDIEKQTVILNVLKEIENEKNGSAVDADYVFGKLRAVGYKNKTLPTIEKIQAKIDSIVNKNQEIDAQISEIEIPENIDEDMMQKLENEKKLIGVFLSGHPMDAYRIPTNTKMISELKGGDVVNICGIIEDYKIRQRKSDNADMSFFTLEDKSGVIEVACFTKAYASFGELLGEGRVVNIRGKVMEEEVSVSNNNTDGDDDSANEEEQKETVLKISVYEVKPMAPASKDLMLEIPDITIWNDLFKECVAQYVSPVGKYHVVLHDILFNEIRETSLHVVPQIKNDPILGSLITTL